jgi:hypothetical protein
MMHPVDLDIESVRHLVGGERRILSLSFARRGVLTRARHSTGRRQGRLVLLVGCIADHDISPLEQPDGSCAYAFR